MPYPRRLIEVDLPIKRISAHARREKSIRHGHISTLHIWWARRPLAACRAVICAALWPDPADPDCPPVFRKAAGKIILDFARKITADTKLANDHCSPENYKLWRALVAQVSQPAVSPISQSAGRSNSPTPSENSDVPQAGSTAIQQTGMSALRWYRRDAPYANHAPSERRHFCRRVPDARPTPAEMPALQGLWPQLNQWVSRGSNPVRSSACEVRDGQRGCQFKGLPPPRLV